MKISEKFEKIKIPEKIRNNLKIRKNLKYPKISEKFEKNRKNLKKLNKSNDFFEDLKSVHSIWEWTTRWDANKNQK